MQTGRVILHLCPQFFSVPLSSIGRGFIPLFTCQNRPGFEPHRCQLIKKRKIGKKGFIDCSKYPFILFFIFSNGLPVFFRVCVTSMSKCPIEVEVLTSILLSFLTCFFMSINDLNLTSYQHQMPTG